jgi:hypothetical protein
MLESFSILGPTLLKICLTSGKVGLKVFCPLSEVILKKFGIRRLGGTRSI